jgi:hypothetical protein
LLSEDHAPQCSSVFSVVRAFDKFLRVLCGYEL